MSKDWKFLRIPIAALLLLMAQCLWAAHISETEAFRRAQRFMSQRGKTLETPARARISTAGQQPADGTDNDRYYIFNASGDQGFVIVSGDDKTVDILGYADKGSISRDNMPDALRYWLGGLAQQIAWAADHDDQAAATRSMRTSALRTAIAPLIQTRWNQGEPYNNLCPVISEERTVTGCVATSMAQLMYYHQCPASTTSLVPGYSKTTYDKDKASYNLTVSELPATSFDWNDMTTTYTSSSTGTSADAVAKLMQYCGAALQMRYGLNSNGGSSAYNASMVEALTTYFGYDGSTTFAERQHYTYQEWVELIYGELASNRPVVLGGQSAGGGHSFVCDGYDTDDFFHINWGWGGTSDGYFRLSALNPDEQGIGGSSSLDGFSYSQDAVIVRSTGSTPAAPRLTLEKLQFDNTGSGSTQQVSLSGDHYPVDLYFEVCNYQYRTTGYDYAVVLTDADGNMIGEPLAYEYNSTVAFNTNVNCSLEDISIPSAALPGSCYLKVMSRVSGSETWLDCFDGEQLKIKAEVSNDKMTLTAPFVYGTVPANVTFTVGATPTAGYELPVTASVTGGSEGYSGDLVLRVNGTAVMGKTVEIPAGQTVDVTFAYIPSAAGDNTLTLWNAKGGGTQINGSKTISVAASDATNDLDLTCTYTIDNQDAGGRLYGNALRASVTVSNASSERKYVGQLNCSVRYWTSTTSGQSTTWSWQSLEISHYKLEVDKGGSTVVNIAADNLPADGYYSFRLTYLRVNGDNTVADLVQIGYDGNENHGTLQVSEGYALGNATGATTIHARSAKINAGDACFVDLRGLSSYEGLTVIPSSNPNCVYLLTKELTPPSGLDGRNVVSCTADGTNEAASLALTDGYDFYTPVAFTAVDGISYTRTFTLPAAATSGWNSLLLPFAFNKVTVGSRQVSWFKSDADTEGAFWLREFKSDAEGRVYFDYVNETAASTPYIIAVPGDTWGDEWKMTDLPVSFSSDGATAIPATSTAKINGNYYKFCGSTVGTSLTSCYVLNDEGSKFKKTTGSSPAFRAWFEAVSISSLTLPSLSIGSRGGATGIKTIARQAEDMLHGGWYTLDGRRLNSRPSVPGLYICNGNKVVIR